MMVKLPDCRRTDMNFPFEVKDKMIREVLVKKADAKHQRPEDDPLARNGKE